MLQAFYPEVECGQGGKTEAEPQLSTPSAKGKDLKGQ
jgi:hypothetical protein